MHQQSRYRKQSTILSLALFGLALMLTSAAQHIAFVPQAQAATAVVTPGSLHDWSFQMSGTASGAFVAGPETPPLGTGSLRLAVGDNGDSGAQFRNDAFDGTRLEDISELRYATYVAENAGCQAPYIVLDIDTDDDGDVDDLLFFEPCYQNDTHTGSTVPDQGDVELDEWQEWDARSGGWWTDSGGTLGPPLTTLNEYTDDHPTARIMNGAGGEGGVRLVAGFGSPSWDDFTGYVDALIIEENGREHIYDFEPAHHTGSSSSSSSMMSSTGSSISSSLSVSSSSSSSSSSVVCDIYADAVTAFDQGDEKGGGTVALNRSDTSKALGHPTAGSPPRFVSLGFSGSITLRFDNYIVNGTGADLRVYESTNAVNYPLDRAQVWARQTSTGAWTLLGTADSSDNANGDLNTTDLDLGPLPWARYIRIIDTTDPDIHLTGADAFDLNAAEALHTTCHDPGSSSSSSFTSSSSSSLTSSSSSSAMAEGVPLCDGKTATVYVDDHGKIVGGSDDGEEYDGVLRGTSGDDVIVGTDDDDRIYGRFGDDIICGAGGSDDLDGGSGDDRIAGEQDQDELDGGNGSDLLCGGADDDELDGGNAPDELDGGPDDDELDGGNDQDICRNGEDNEDCESISTDDLAACASFVTTYPEQS